MLNHANIVRFFAIEEEACCAIRNVYILSDLDLSSDRLAADMHTQRSNRQNGRVASHSQLEGHQQADSDYLRYLRRKHTVTPLPTTPENCHRTTL